MIRAVLFDFDGVLTLAHSGTQNTCENLSRTTGVDKDKLFSCYREFKDLARGKVLHKDVWDAWCACVGSSMDISLLDNALTSIEKNEDMFTLNQKLRATYKTGIITDNSKERFALLSEKLRLDSSFDVLCNSGNIGSMKWEDERIFIHALERLGLKANQCVFIDNSKGNLVIPSKMGFHTVYFDDAKDTVQILEQKLIDLGVCIS